MTTEEIIRGLRQCAATSSPGTCAQCPYRAHPSDCISRLARDAADRIEALLREIGGDGK